MDFKHWPLVVLKPFELQEFTVSHVSPNKGPIDICLVKSVSALSLFKLPYYNEYVLRYLRGVCDQKFIAVTWLFDNETIEIFGCYRKLFISFSK